MEICGALEELFHVRFDVRDFQSHVWILEESCEIVVHVWRHHEYTPSFPGFLVNFISDMKYRRIETFSPFDGHFS